MLHKVISGNCCTVFRSTTYTLYTYAHDTRSHEHASYTSLQDTTANRAHAPHVREFAVSLFRCALVGVAAAATAADSASRITHTVQEHGVDTTGYCDGIVDVMCVILCIAHIAVGGLKGRCSLLSITASNLMMSVVCRAFFGKQLSATGVTSGAVAAAPARSLCAQHHQAVYRHRFDRGAKVRARIKPHVAISNLWYNGQYLFPH